MTGENVQSVLEQEMQLIWDAQMLQGHIREGTGRPQGSCLQGTLQLEPRTMSFEFTQGPTYPGSTANPSLFPEASPIPGGMF